MGLRICVEAALISHNKMTIHLAFELQQSPTRPTTTGLSEIAISNFSSCRLGGREQIRSSRRGWCWIQRYDRSFFRPSLLGGSPLLGSVPWWNALLGSVPATVGSHARRDVQVKWREKKENGGSGGKTQQSASSTVKKNSYHSRHPFPCR